MLTKNMATVKPSIPEKTFGRPDPRMGRGRKKRRHLRPRARVAIAVILAIVGLAAVAVNYFRNAAGPKEFGQAPETVGGVGLDGAGGDPLLNRLKNRIAAPDEKIIREFSVAQIVGIPHDILDQEGKRRRATWYPSSLLAAKKYESMGVRVTGYILRAKQSGLESANGYIDSLRDYHIWLSDSPEGQRNNSMIAEITPRWKIVHPEWRLRFFNELAEQRAKVRVTGWLLWDEEHASEVEKSRGTQWEIHPATKFEVWTGGVWRELSGNVAQQPS
jgi:hypothetical protein